MKKGLLLALAGLALVSFVTGCSTGEQAITSLEDAKNARIGVMTGSTGEEIAHARFPKAKIKSFDDVTDTIAALKSGQLDAVITAYPTVIQIAKTNPEIGQLPEPLDSELTAIALKKGNDDLLAAVNRIITELKADGTLESMKKRWFKADLSPYEEPELRLPTGGKVLKIGVNATREPFSFVDKKGRVSGHDGELARTIGVKLGRPIEFSDMKFSALIPALQSGKIDMIVTGMTATNERRKSIDFTQDYFTNAQVLVIKKSPGAKSASARPTGSGRADSSTGISRLAQLQGKRICVLTGSAGDLAARKSFPKATFQQFVASADAALAVKTDKADAFIYDKSVLLNLLSKNPELAILGEPVSNLEVSAALNKNNPALLAQINTVLQQLKSAGTLKSLRLKWIDTKYAQTPEMPPVAGGPRDGVLRMGTCATLEPFSFQSNNKLTGLDIELGQMIGAGLGKRIEIVDMSFEGLIPALQTGKIDFALSNFNVTEERRKLIAFSQPYLENDISALVRRPAQAGLDQSARPSGAPEGAPATFLSSVVNGFYSNIILENRYLLILNGLKTTVLISVLATVFGTLLGALVCFMRISGNKLLNLPARVYISIMRGTPVLVVLMLTYYVVFASLDINPVLVAVIAFGMNFAAYLAEIFRTGIEGVDKGQTEAGIAMGFTRVKTFLNVILPQATRRILPIYKGEFISLVKMTSIVGYIAVQDLTKASDIIRSRTFDAFFPLVMVAILYFLISWILMQSLEYLERSTDPKSKRAKGARA